MAEDDTIEEGALEQFEQRLTPCIERGELDACVEEAARLADELRVYADDVLRLAVQMANDGKLEFSYVLALAAAGGMYGYGKAIAYNNAGLSAQYLGNVDKAEAHYLKAIEVDPNYALSHVNYATLLHKLSRIEEAEYYFIKSIEAAPKLAMAHYNYAVLLRELNRCGEAEDHYIKAIKANPKLGAAHYNYANLLNELNRNDEAEDHYIKAIKANPTDVMAHGAYAYLLIDNDRRNEALSETEATSELLKETGHITQSYLAKAFFYHRYSEKYLSRKEYVKSSDDAGRASDEYFEAAKTADGDQSGDFTLQGNVLKAKSFVRKIPPKPWYNKIYKRLGIKPDIRELVHNLQNAAIWYQKASLCPIDGKKDVCGACHLSISVFSEVLGAMNAFICGNNVEITKDKWLNSLEGARKTYTDKELDRGIALVDSLKQLVKCVDELAEQKAIGLKIQEERLGKCYDNLTTVNENLDGVLGIISDHATEAIRDYAKKEGMAGFVGEVDPKKSFFDNWLVKATIGAFVTIILGIIANQLFEWRIQDMVFAGIFNM